MVKNDKPLVLSFVLCFTKITAMLPILQLFVGKIVGELWQDDIFLLEKTQPLSLSQGSAIFSSFLPSTTTRFADVIK